jgi:hypothetical protein
MGWFRHLADPAQRLRRYLKLETMGFERDLAGIPVGRAPLQRINQLVKDGKLTKEAGRRWSKSLEDFVKIAAKEPSTGLVLDSEPFRAKTEPARRSRASCSGASSCSPARPVEHGGARQRDPPADARHGADHRHRVAAVGRSGAGAGVARAQRGQVAQPLPDLATRRWAIWPRRTTGIS